MQKRIITAFVLVMAFAAQAQAATISLVPSSSSVVIGSPLTVSLLLNALDVPGPHPGDLYSGKIVINFDPLLLTYSSYTPAGAVSVPTGPTVATVGSQRTVTLSFNSPNDNDVVGSFSFTAIGSPDSIAQIGIADFDDFFGTFISHYPTNQRFHPTFTGTSVTIAPVPLPGAGWLLLTGAGLIGLRARPRACRPFGKDA